VPQSTASLFIKWLFISQVNLTQKIADLHKKKGKTYEGDTNPQS